MIMRIWYLSLWWTIFFDILAWLVIHLGVSYAMTQLPLKVFQVNQWLYRKRPWEKEGKIYENIFRVKQWKGLLPEGAALFKKGFRKKSLRGKNQVYLEEFLKETCRAELTHWITICFAPVFFLWNPFGAGVFMIFYAVAANLPCIIAQRYNRLRLSRIIRTANRL